MLQPTQIEQLIKLVAAMDRQILVSQCRCFHGAFPVDFTEDYLRRMPLDRLRHVFVALCLQNSYLPSEAAEAV
jgi:hypothetical protein